MKQKIYGTVWFNTLQGECIGIVTMNNGHEDKAYIGVPKTGDEEKDTEYILSYGTPFPFEQAIILTGGK